jgi:hypothetical protein
MNQGGKLGTFDRGCSDSFVLVDPINFVPVKPRAQVVSELFIKIMPHRLQPLLVGLCVCDPGGE